MSDRIYIRGFPADFTTTALKAFFRPYGKIRKAYIVNETEESPKLYGIVRYYNPDNSFKAIEAVHEKTLESITWYVAICEAKATRKKELRSKVSEFKRSQIGKNLFVRDFPETWTQEILLETFSKYGTVLSAKLDGKKAFVHFSTEDEAKNAIASMKTLLFEGKKLYVTLWKDKRELERIISKTKIKRAQKASEPKVAAVVPENEILNKEEVPKAVEEEEKAKVEDIAAKTEVKSDV